MTTVENAVSAQPVSVVSGPPLTEEPGLGTLTLPGFLREVTTAYADREALVMHESGDVTRWSYTDLWERAIEVARALRAVGIGKDSRVGVLMTNRPEWIAATFGTSLVGGVAVALSTFSTAAELDLLIGTSGISVLLFERTVANRDLAEALTDLEPKIGGSTPGDLQSVRYPHLRYLAAVGAAPAGGAVESWDTFVAGGRDVPREIVEATAAGVEPSDTAVLFFSSGTTSKPKGILSAHRGVSIQSWRFGRMYGFEPADDVRCWSANGFFWSGNFGMALGATLSKGGSLVLQSMFDAAEALALMQRERVNFPVAWPHQWAQLEAAPNWAGADLSAMRFVDNSTPIARHPSVSVDYREPGHAYGNTETFTISTAYPANTPDDVTAGSSGVPLPGVTVKVVEPLSGTPVPIGDSGEICVKGPTLMLGYLGVPLSETLDAEGFFHTGDGGHLDADGRLFWEGRLNDIIKTGGANVSPLEVDEALIGLPGVKVARTVGVPHDTLGEVVVACIVPHDGTNLEADTIRAHLREQLASYKVPRHVLFFGEDEITLTGSAKIKTDEVRTLATERLRNP
ncbi:class I adenylate-forming enzyme family protein [Rhodococcus phenolicus]|uniref:class I adenylate-forming enzyme family protein n=1 Tax=Rhodococcus phenolicus TaxID=263849 RepID=UPI00082BA8C3|nr:class I adenylate-forming enzyme family protein [Rhodococcus phenolicus]